ncbi:MAG: enoyl-CoA hydratase/isomerase family protein [Actinomycetota bacterium]|nr:enoyl-CoA hydratase/isomerase family protein [Actinomycetota bacterium]
MSDIRRVEGDGVLTLTFTRDEKLNAVTEHMLQVIEEAVDDLSERDDLCVLVITAEGRYFTSGLDITTLSADVGLGPDGIVRGSNLRRDYRAQARHDLWDRMEHIEKPVVLAAQGHCFGIGVEMGASCDFRLASDVATFALPEVPNLAVIPGSGGISRLTRLVGPHWATWMAMAGERVSARQAMDMGLVHAVYPVDDFTAAVSAFARRLAGYPREAMGMAKLAIGVAADVDRRTARDFDRVTQTVLFQSAEYRSKVDAFVNRSAR